MYKFIGTAKIYLKLVPALQNLSASSQLKSRATAPSSSGARCPPTKPTTKMRTARKRNPTARKKNLTRQKTIPCIKAAKRFQLHIQRLAPPGVNIIKTFDIPITPMALPTYWPHQSHEVENRKHSLITKWYDDAVWCLPKWKVWPF